LLCHGRPEAFLLALNPRNLVPNNTKAIGYINQRETLDIECYLPNATHGNMVYQRLSQL